MSKVLPFLKATDWLFDIVPLRLVPRMNYWSAGVEPVLLSFMASLQEPCSV